MFSSLSNGFDRIKDLLNSRNVLSAVMLGGMLAASASSTVLKNRRYIITDGINTTSIVSFCKEVGKVLSNANIKINENDKVLINDVDTLTTNINIRRAVPVTVFVDGKESKVHLPEGSTVENALNKLQINLGSEDILNISKDAVVNNETRIVIDRVEYKTSTFTQDIPFSVEKRETDSLLKGATKLERAGVLGKKEITVKDKFVNGALSNSERFENVMIEPQNQIELVGTRVYENRKNNNRNKAWREARNRSKSMPAIGTFVDSSGKTVAYKAVHHGVCTAYCDGKIGAMGTFVKAGEDIAVNPAVIPLGSKVYIPGYGYAKATDTGGAMLRRKNPVLADLRMSNEQECRRHGRRNMTVYVLA